MANELFMLGNIGENLKLSLLAMFNGIKNTLVIPRFFRNVFITSIPKKKKFSSLLLEKERGIFLVTKLRAIFSKLLYNSIIETIEENLSKSSIGARKGRSPRDHLFVINSILNEVINSKSHKEIDLVFYNVKEAFDSLPVEHTL